MEVVCRSLIAPGLLKTSWQSGQQGKENQFFKSIVVFRFIVHSMVRLVMKYFELSKLQVLQFVAGSPIYCGLSTPNQPTTQFIAACVEDGEWVLMGGPHNFLLSTHFYTIPHSSTLSPVRGYISRDPPPCLTDSFSCYLRFPVCSGPPTHIVPCSKEGYITTGTTGCV